MSEPTENTVKYGRNADGTFAKGNAGKPKGARHRATQAVQELLDKDGEAPTSKAVEMARGGDITALCLCLERIAPARRDSPVNFDLPPMKSAQDATGAAQAVLRAVSGGQLTPLEGASIMALVDAVSRRALIVRPNNASECVLGRDDETEYQFRARVDRISTFQEANEQSERIKDDRG